MNKSHKLFNIEECKIHASKLLKLLKSNDATQVKQAVKRLKKLPEFKKLSFEEIAITKIQRKHALAVIAFEKGFKSWAELKMQLPFIRGGFLNQWFVDYAEAKTYLKTQNDFLLPFKKQFFICDADYIKNLGFDPDDSDWKLIANDWVQPKDKIAWRRLYKKWMQIQGAKHE